MKLHKYVIPTVLAILSIGHLSNTCKVLYNLNPLQSNYYLDWFTAIISGLGLGISTVIFALSGRTYVAILAALFDFLISIIYYNSWYVGEYRMYVTGLVGFSFGALIYGYSELVKDYKEEKKRK
jgi:hypothetical protein